MLLIQLSTCRGALARRSWSRASTSSPATWASSALQRQRRWQSTESTEPTETEKPYYVTTPIFYVNSGRSLPAPAPVSPSSRMPTS
ncbi:hypothetical protein IMZ48_20070 [Candidatus Bathyarchaeota archaeon]|nr:hypothetical protein [Candidatus Bathyarchaeota archaeon]